MKIQPGPIKRRSKPIYAGIRCPGKYKKMMSKAKARDDTTAVIVKTFRKRQFLLTLWRFLSGYTPTLELYTRVVAIQKYLSPIKLIPRSYEPTASLTQPTQNEFAAVLK